MKRLAMFVALLTAFSVTTVACKKNNKPPAQRDAKDKANTKDDKGSKKNAVKATGKTFVFNPKATKFAWTAYKYTSKAAVKGHFEKFTTTGTKSGKSVQEVLKGIKFAIDTTSVKTGNVARNISIAINFFKKFTGGPTINAEVVKIEGKDKGKLHVKLSLHSMSKTVPFDYTVSPGGKLEATATIDMLKLGLKIPYDSIHKACEKLHTGKDGVSKTWTEVKLTVTSQATIK